MGKNQKTKKKIIRKKNRLTQKAGYRKMYKKQIDFKTSLLERLKFLQHDKPDDITIRDLFTFDTTISSFLRLPPSSRPTVSGRRPAASAAATRSKINIDSLGTPIKSNIEKYVNSVQNNINDISTRLQEPEYIKNKTYIIHYDCHGSISDIPNLFSYVPDNTIICFLAPLNYLAYVDTFNYSINLPDFDFITALQAMSVNQYLDLFKYREYVGDKYDFVAIHKKIKVGIFNEPYAKILYNCFKNSIFYYPGQLYPDMNMSISPQDLKSKNPNNFQSFFYEVNSAKNRVEVISANSTNSPHPFHSRKEIEDYFRTNDSLRFSSRDVINYNRPDASNKLKLVLVTSCRPFMNPQAKINNYYQLETFNYELVKMCTKKFYIDNIKDKNNLPSHGLCTNCDFVSNKAYDFAAFKIRAIDRNSQFNTNYLKNVNYNGLVPELMKIINKIVNPPSEDTGLKELTHADANFVASLSPRKMVLFFKKIKDTIKKGAVESKDYLLYIDSLVEKAPRLFMETIIKYAKYLRFPINNSCFFSSYYQKLYEPIVKQFRILEEILTELTDYGLSVDFLNVILSRMYTSSSAAIEFGDIVKSNREFLIFNEKLEINRDIDYSKSSCSKIYLYNFPSLTNENIKNLKIFPNLVHLYLKNEEKGSEIETYPTILDKPLNIKSLTMEVNIFINTAPFPGYRHQIGSATKVSHIRYFSILFPKLETLHLKNILVPGTDYHPDFYFKRNELSSLKNIIIENTNFNITDFLNPNIQILHIIKNSSAETINIQLNRNFIEVILQDLDKLKQVNLIPTGEIKTLILRGLNDITINAPENSIYKLEILECSNVTIGGNFKRITVVNIKNSRNINFINQSGNVIHSLEVENHQETSPSYELKTAFEMTKGVLNLKNSTEYTIPNFECINNIKEVNLLYFKGTPKSPFTKDLIRGFQGKKLWLTRNLVLPDVIPKYKGKRLGVTFDLYIK